MGKRENQFLQALKEMAPEEMARVIEGIVANFIPILFLVGGLAYLVIQFWDFSISAWMTDTVLQELKSRQVPERDLGNIFGQTD